MTKKVGQIQDDFNNVMDYFLKKGVLNTKTRKQFNSEAKTIHRLTYSLMWWRFQLSKPKLKNRYIFLWEISSDALQILPQSLMGYSKTTKLLIRGIIENTLRHIYYYDHPVEYQRLNLEKKWYLSINQLFDYLKQHPILYETEKRFDAISRLNNLYSELSNYVHGSKVKHLEMKPGLESIKPNLSNLQTIRRLIKRCVESTNFLIAIHHKNIFSKLQLDAKQIITLTMPQTARRVITGI